MGAQYFKLAPYQLSPAPSGSDIQRLSAWRKDDRLGPFEHWLAKIEIDPPATTY
jgi:hypothetical protein